MFKLFSNFLCSHASSAAAEDFEFGMGAEDFPKVDVHGAEVDEADIVPLPNWSDMERYFINFEEWMYKKLGSKQIARLQRPVVGPSPRREEVGSFMLI